MAFLRPEVAALLTRYREVVLAAAVALAGLWVATRGGWFLGPLGALIVLTGSAFAAIGLRRLRFSQTVTDPGIVRVVEGQLAYLGPFGGGFAGLGDLEELALIRQGPARFWRLTQQQGAPLMVPVAAMGAEALFDAFAGLPGLDSAALIAALEAEAQGEQVIWRRRTRLRAV